MSFMLLLNIVLMKNQQFKFKILLGFYKNGKKDF